MSQGDTSAGPVGAAVLRVGCLGPSDKHPKFFQGFQERFPAQCVFLAVDEDSPLEVVRMQRAVDSSPPLDILLCKMNDSVLRRELFRDPQAQTLIQEVEKLAEIHECVMVNSLESVAHTVHRGDVLRLLQKIAGELPGVQVPVFREARNIQELVKMASSEEGEWGLQYPLFVKSQDAFGTDISHTLAIVHSLEQLQSLDWNFPVLAQNFIDHGGVVWKVYAVGEQTWCNGRLSVRDVATQEKRCLSFDSQQAFPEEWRAMVQEGGMPSGPEPHMVQTISDSIRRHSGLDLFGFDILMGVDGIMYLIDLNAFPGYKELADTKYDVIMKFLEQRVAEERQTVRVAVCGPHHHWNKTCGPFVARYHDQKTIHAFALDLDANAEVGVEFDVLLHKMNDDIMSAEALCSEVAQSKLDMLQKHLEANPNAVILNPLDAVRRTLSRNSLLQLLQNAVESLPVGLERTVKVPASVFSLDSSGAVQSLRENGVLDSLGGFPLICKADEASFTEASHLIAVVSSWEQLEALQWDYPLIVQQFVPHNGVVHKLYVIGDCHFCGPRNSVRNIGVGDEAITFDSQQAIPEELRDPRAPLETGTQLEEEILGHLVPSLRHTLELDLFGVDVLEAPDGTLFLVDANAFPGYKTLGDRKFGLIKSLVVQRGRQARI